MNTWFFFVLIGFAVVLVIHSWLLMSIGQKYDEALVYLRRRAPQKQEEKFIKKRKGRPTR